MAIFESLFGSPFTQLFSSVFESLTEQTKTLADLLLEQTYAHSAPTNPIDFDAHAWAISGAL